MIKIKYEDSQTYLLLKHSNFLSFGSEGIKLLKNKLTDETILLLSSLSE